MQRKQFNLIAKTLLSTKPPRGNYAGAQHSLDQWNDTVKAFGETLKTTNAAFDRAKFYDACGADPNHWRI